MKLVSKMKADEAKKFFLKKESYFNVELPEYFDLEKIINQVMTIVGNEKNFKKFKCDEPKRYESVNYKMMCNKDGKYGWRPFEIIHPLKYIELVTLITEETNWRKIKQRFKDFSKNEKIKCCSIPRESPSKKNDKKSVILSWWSQFEQRSINYAIKYSYMAKTDITNCYSSIYTHSIGWAIHTREYCKKNKNENNLGRKIDSIIQDLSYGQTNGIPQGSVLMDFIAELILGFADEMLSERIKDIKNYEILRYRDDYRIFSNEKSVVEKIMKELSEVLSIINLKLNESKTKVTSDIITESIKPDKLYCLEIEIKEKKLLNKLLIIRNVGKKFPNSGALNKLLSNLYKNEIINYKTKINNFKQCISIITDIMYNNPRTYSICTAILSKFLEPLKPSVRLCLIDDIILKFKDIPNTEYLNIWLQRLTIIDDRNKLYSTLLCEKIYKKNIIWNSKWINFNIDESVMIDETIIKKITYVIPKNVVDIFNNY